MSNLQVVAETSEVQADAAQAASPAESPTPLLAAPADSLSNPGGESAAQRKLMLHMPIDVRSASLALIALILSLYALQWAKEIVVPILTGVMMSYALTPIVDRMARLHIPRAAGASLLLSAILGLMGWGAWALSDQTDALIDTVPQVSETIRELSKRASDKPSTFERMQQVATELAAAAAAESSAPSGAAAGTSASPKAAGARPLPTGSASGVNAARQSQTAPRVAPDAVPLFDLRSYLVSGTLGVMSFLGKIAVIFFVALFLIASGNTFRRKMVKLAGPKLSQKKVTIETLDEITGQIQRYLLVQVGVSVVVGICTWLAFVSLGMHNAGVWGVVAAVTNLIPYLGALVVGGGAGVVALVQFGTPEMAIIISATSFAIHTVIGNVLTPWWMGRASKMSPVAVFIAVLVFGWLWGVWGLLLGVPMLLVAKSVCDRVEDLKPIGELLGA